MSSLTDWINATPERRREYEQERLTVDVAEGLQGLLDKVPMKRAELARRMGTSRQSLHQMLSGEQNLTLRTMAIMAHELGCRVSVKFEPYSSQETSSARCSCKDFPGADQFCMAHKAPAAPPCDCEGPQKVGADWHAPYCSTVLGGRELRERLERDSLNCEAE